MSVDVGSKAPDFTLMNQDASRSRSARSAASPWCWRSFPAAFSGCARRSCARSATRMAQLNQANAQVYGISVDTFFTLKAFQRSAEAHVSAAERLQQAGDPRLRRVQRGHDRPEGHRQARGVRHRQGRHRPPPRGARGRAERAGLREGVRGPRVALGAKGDWRLETRRAGAVWSTVTTSLGSLSLRRSVADSSGVDSQTFATRRPSSASTRIVRPSTSIASPTRGAPPEPAEHVAADRRVRRPRRCAGRTAR